MKRAVHIRDFIVEFTFTDGSKRQIDLEAFLAGPVFQPWREAEQFKRFKVRYGSIVWPNGAGIAPETLYDELGPTYEPAMSTQHG